MELNIYNKEGQLKATVSPADSSTLAEGLMADYVLSLSFVLFDRVQLDVNDYVDFLGKRYRMLEAYIPNQKSTIEWSYNTKFYGIESVIRRALCLKTVDNELNPVFSLTAPAIEQVRLVVENINRVMGTTDWKVGEVIATDNLTIDYNGTYCNDALASIATAAETEWWIDGLTVNLCRCEYGELIELGYGSGLKEITLDTNENAKFFTRLFPMGSNRNIDPKKYGSSRLHLPGGVKYLEQNTHYGIIEHYEEAAFAAIYPRRVGKVGVVRKETKTGENKKPFDIYYFTDPELNFNPNEYVIAGLIKQIVFETGDLAGRDFEVNYHADKKEFEIITQWPYDNEMQLPGALVMKPGDDYILYNITMPTEYYALAETEFETAVAEYMNKNKLDKSVYKAPTDYIDLSKRNVSLTVGQRIHLMSDKYFPEIGYRDSRITKITRKVNEPLSADIEISDLANPGGKAVMEQGVKDAKHYAQAALSGLPDMIKSWENTPESDSNLYTAKKSVRSFVSRLLDDVVAGLITFLKGIKIGHFVSGSVGGTGAYINERGYAEMQGLRLNEFLEVPELRFNRIDVVSGELWNAIAFGIIESVNTLDQIATLKLESGELRSVRLNDFARGLFHNLVGNATISETDGCGFLTIPGFSTAYFSPTKLLADGKSFQYELKPGTKVHPCKAMKFAVYGNATDKSRQASAYATRTYQRYLVGVNTWEIDPNRNISAQYGDVEGLTINGYTMHGTGSYQSNGYFAGYIQFTPEQKDELKGENGKDGYSVSLSSYDAVVAVNSDGEIDTSLYDIINIVTGRELAYTGVNQLVTTKYKIQATIQAMQGGTKLEQSDALGTGKYIVSVAPVGCEYSISNGVITLTKIMQDKATLDIEVNCEGIAVFNKTFTLTRVYAGQDANLLPWVEQWNNNKTLIDAEYVVSPKMFSGTRGENGKLTGIAQGRECITLNGVKRTGIFALVDDEVVFELDPISKKYLFKGDIYTPPTKITYRDIDKYFQVSPSGNMYYIKLDATGLNIQFENMVGNRNMILEFPRDPKYAGAEIGLYITDLESVVNVQKIAYRIGDATLGFNIHRSAGPVRALEFKRYRCVVMEPFQGYPYDLINGKIIEWITV